MWVKENIVWIGLVVVPTICLLEIHDMLLLIKKVITFTTLTRGLNGVVFLPGASYIVWYTSCVVSRLDWRLL
jgi:hypothetical protein